MSDAQLVSRFFKQGRQIAVTVRKTVGKLKTVVRLNALHLDPAACIPRRQLTKKVCRRISRLFCAGSKEPQTAELVNSSVLKQTKLGICNTAAWNDFHIHLDALAGMGHLLVWLGFAGVFRLFGRKHPKLSHHAEQALRAASVSTLPQAVPEFDHAKRRIPAAHIADLLQFVVCVLIWMAVGPSGLAGKGCRTSIPSLLPEVDVRPALVVLPAGTADAVFFCILH